MRLSEKYFIIWALPLIGLIVAPLVLVAIFNNGCFLLIYIIAVFISVRLNDIENEKNLEFNHQQELKRQKEVK